MSPLISMNELRRKGIEAMEEYARTHNAEYRPLTLLKPPMLLRVYRGSPVEYKLKSESAGTQNGPPTLTTHIRAPFANTGDFTFSCFRRSGVLRMLDRHGKHSADTGDAAFDEAFSAKSSDPELLRRFLSDPAYRALLSETAAGLDVADQKEDGLFNKRTKDLHYVKFFVYSFITEVAGIERAFDLVDRTLDRLALLGVAKLPD